MCLGLNLGGWDCHDWVRPIKIHPRFHFPESLGEVEDPKQNLGSVNKEEEWILGSQPVMFTKIISNSLYSDQQLRASYMKTVGNIFRMN